MSKIVADACRFKSAIFRWSNGLWQFSVLRSSILLQWTPFQTPVTKYDGIGSWQSLSVWSTGIFSARCVCMTSVERLALTSYLLCRIISFGTKVTCGIRVVLRQVFLPILLCCTFIAVILSFPFRNPSVEMDTEWLWIDLCNLLKIRHLKYTKTILFKVLQ